MREYLHGSIPDGEVLPIYLDPDFWVSGAFVHLDSPRVRSIPAGAAFVSWLWAIQNQPEIDDPIGEFAAECCSVFLVKKNASNAELITHAWARPREIFFQKSTVFAYAQLPEDDPMCCTETVRQSMAQFARDCPFLLDVLKTDAKEDFRVWNGYQTARELQKYHIRIPGQRFRFYEQLYPWLLADLYEGIRIENDVVVDYRIKNVTVEFLSM